MEKMLLLKLYLQKAGFPIREIEEIYVRATDNLKTKYKREVEFLNFDEFYSFYSKILKGEEDQEGADIAYALDKKYLYTTIYLLLKLHNKLLNMSQSFKKSIVDILKECETPSKIKLLETNLISVELSVFPNQYSSPNRGNYSHEIEMETFFNVYNTPTERSSFSIRHFEDEENEETVQHSFEMFIPFVFVLFPQYWISGWIVIERKKRTNTINVSYKFYFQHRTELKVLDEYNNLQQFLSGIKGAISKLNNLLISLKQYF